MLSRAHPLENLSTLCNISLDSKISYANVRAFQNMIEGMDLVKLIIRKACDKGSDGKITKTELLNEAAKMACFSLFTTRDAKILFDLPGFDEPSGRLCLFDFAKVFDPSWRHRGQMEDLFAFACRQFIRHCKLTNITRAPGNHNGVMSWKGKDFFAFACRHFNRHCKLTNITGAPGNHNEVVS